MNPFDFAWMLLKGEDYTPSHFGGVESFPERVKNVQEHGDVRGKKPEGGWSGKQLEIGQDIPTGDTVEGWPDIEPAPDLEEPAAMAPDKPPSGMSPEERLEALLAEHPQLAGHPSLAGGEDEPV